MEWKILYLEDDTEMQTLLAKFLPPETTLHKVSTIKEAKDCLLRNDYHIILVDLMLESESGFDFLEHLKQQEFNFQPSLLVITASDREGDEIRCHEVDVQEFIKKPIRPQVVSSQIKKHIRRFEEKNKVQRVGPLLVDEKKMEVRLRHDSGDQNLPLTFKEYKLLLKLIDNPGKTLTREELFVEVWEGSHEVQTRTIDMHVSALRKKLGPHGSLISSVRGVGYMLLSE